MKKNIKISSLVLACMLIVTVFGGTSAFAASPAFLSFYPTGNRTIQVNAKDYFQILSSALEAPTVKADDEAKLKVEFDKQVGDATLKTYQYRYEGLKAGNVTVTVASKDNMTAKETFTVKENTTSSDKIVIKSDTVGDLKLKEGGSYIFKITSTNNGVAYKPTFNAGNAKVLEVRFLNQNKNNYYYKVTAIGKAGQATGVYTSAPGLKAVLQSKAVIISAVATATKPEKITLKCDTTGEFAITKGAKYCFKISADKGDAPSFTLGTKGVFASKLLKKSGNDYFYEITATGEPGQSAGVYTTVKGQNPVKQCKVLIARG